MKKQIKVRSELALKVRVSELETRLDNIHKLVANIAFNQDTIVKALESNDKKE